MAKYVPNRKSAPLLWPEMNRLVQDIAERVAADSNRAFSAVDPRRVVVPGIETDQPARRRHRASVVAASGAAIRDQARTNRLLAALSRARI